MVSANIEGIALASKTGRIEMRQTIYLLLANSHTRGQGLAEYALLLSLIAIAVIATLLFMGGNIKTILSTIGKSL
jgi:Flp pilus assembly pilin Flp